MEIFPIHAMFVEQAIRVLVWSVGHLSLTKSPVLSSSADASSAIQKCLLLLGTRYPDNCIYSPPLICLPGTTGSQQDCDRKQVEGLT